MDINRPDVTISTTDGEAETSPQVERPAGKDHTVDISTYVQVGKQIPVHGIWFEIVKCEGPYVMLRAVGMTSRARRELLTT